MAVKKASKAVASKVAKETDVTIDVQEVDVDITEDIEDGVDIEVTEDNDTEETPEVAIEVPEVVIDVKEEKEVNIEVDTTPIDETTQAVAKTVRIRMRADMRFWNNTELYDLKKGQCYNVPVSIKKRLNKAGVLLPL